MEPFHHRFSDLFRQLGLPSDKESILSFLAEHSPLDPAIRLENAPFWNESQSALLRDEIVRNADWAEVVERLNVALRSPALR